MHNSINNNKGFNQNQEKENLPYLKEWQHVIAKYVIDLNHYPVWTTVAEKFNVYRKCDGYVLYHLKKWYASLKSKNNIKDLNSYLSDKIIAVPPSCIQSNVMSETDIDSVKKRILAYLERYLVRKSWETKAPLNYSYIIDNLGIEHKFRRSALKPIKCWYNSLHNDWLCQYNNNTKNLNLNSEPIVLDINNSKKTLPELTVQVFSSIKLSAINIGQDEQEKYYQKFFKMFTSDLIKSSLCIQHGSQGIQEMQKFNKVTNLKTFKNYLSSIPGLYPKLVLWTIQNPFNINNNSFQFKHHVMPEFLINAYQFDKDKIHQKYNVVQVSWVIHFLLHLVRLVEYGQPQEGLALRTFVKYGNSNKVFNSFSELVKTFHAVFNTTLLNNFADYESKLAEVRNKGLKAAQLARLSKNTKQALSIDTTWRDCSNIENSNLKFDFVHAKQNPQDYTLNTLAKSILNNYNKRSDYYKINHYFSDQDIPKISRRLTSYLAGRNRETSLYGFYWEGALSPVLPRRRNIK